MTARQLPLLMASVGVVNGPHVPTTGLHGRIRAEGLANDDVVEVYGVEEDKTLRLLGHLDEDIGDLVFNPKTFTYIRAIRSASSGQPISVWAA